MEGLQQQVKVKGGVFISRYFNDINDINALDEEIVINCSSMGSRYLFEDDDFIPVRGEIIYFRPQPGIDYSTYEGTEDSNYWVKLYPWQDRLILNGVYEAGEEQCELNQNVIQKILSFARDKFKC